VITTISKFITVAWCLISCALLGAGGFVSLSSKATIKVNGEDVGYLLGGICLLISTWFISIAYANYHSHAKYTLVSSVVLACALAGLLASQISLVLSGELIAYKYLVIYCSILLLSIASVGSSFYQLKFSAN